MIGKHLLALGWLMWLLTAVPPAAPERLHVTSLAKDGRVYVSFSLLDGVTPELREAIRSGLPATITYEVELRRPETLWFDRTVASSQVTATARFDNLTRQHQLLRTIDGRGEEPRVVEDDDAVREWLTVFDRLPLFDTSRLEANTEYYVRVRAQTRPRVTWVFFWPWGQGSTTGYAARFTYIQ
ncbi:MAG: DUF4390 domain-containing protein [Acidobacteria bacterium]|nr:MAG: DUF4390 domain-containing protein [Acidobacteriota bacterium]RPJ74681.1 MAG: DUF4390 domain-containing protein [Acidobacteriota bacterium]